MNKVLKVHSADDMIVALADLKAGEKIAFEGNVFELVTNVPAKHKFATRDFAVGESLKMYGVVVGKAMKPIKKGELISTENLKHAAEEYSVSKKESYQWESLDITKFKERTFNGYIRTDGRVGTANYWLFIPTVFCENRNLDVIKEALHNELGYSTNFQYKALTRQLVDSFIKSESLDQVNFAPQATPSKQRVFKNIDGIKFLNHQGGCGGTRQDSAVLSKLLAAYADHPNVAGVTVLSLGCQHLQVDDFKKEILSRNPNFDKPLLMFEQQKEGTEEQLLTEAIKQTFVHLIEANKIERTPAPVNKLVLGVKCGGSDGFSGISANPALGYAADLLVSLGGTVLLAEFPELNGVEQELINRSTTPEIAGKFENLMRAYSAQAEAAGSGFHMNPSPGNIKDGLITDAIKSAGAARKGGLSPVTDVLDYTEPATKPGLNLVCTPGNDVEATTGKAASGATIIVFTTGLGTPTGNPVCPVIKISTTDALAARMPDIIDLNTGDIISKGISIKEKGEEILDFCIRVASGEITPKAVLLNQDDFIPWKRGVSL